MELTTTYNVTSCASCDFQFALPVAFIKRRKNDHKSFYCPSCGELTYWPQLSDKERLEHQLSSVQECCTQYEEESESLHRSNIALKGHLTRKKNKEKQLKVGMEQRPIT
jgi:predicted RNA-binding Zn-ribbon protein involved in translation (DUF1610 family)